MTQAEDYYARGCTLDGTTAIESISEVYGKQAVVVSVDPRRVYVKSPADVPHKTIETKRPGPNGERYCWYQCTVAGGREGRPLGAPRRALRLGGGRSLRPGRSNRGRGGGGHGD